MVLELIQTDGIGFFKTLEELELELKISISCVKNLNKQKIIVA